MNPSEDHSHAVISSCTQVKTENGNRFFRNAGIWLACCAAWSLPLVAQTEMPEVRDSRLQLTLVATEPEIVTPIGIAVDAENRLFVVESHTHEAKADYPGPKYDRVKMFVDSDGDGKPEKITTFADDLRFAMNLAFSPTGELYLTHRSGVLLLQDKDRDGVCDGKIPILTLETTEMYPHNGIDGIAFSSDGWLYVGLGENLGRAYTLKGTDGSSVSGGGEGGSVFRCRADGSEVQRFATGFWNPFALEFDRSGRLFCVDNDPDGRPPCRLLHVIQDGDFGYKFRYGRSGLHPFVSWEGELAGTLPMVSGTGEAPSGMLDGGKTRLPDDFNQSLLVTSWGDNAIERYPLRAAGASFRSERQVLIQGDKSFRPVGIAADRGGVIYITDWADKSYPVHQKGRIWRLSSSATPDRANANRPTSPLGEAERKLQRLQQATTPAAAPELLAALVDADPFVRFAAITALSKVPLRALALENVGDSDPGVRLGVLLALRRGGLPNPADVLKQALADPDEEVRAAAIHWIGEEGIVSQIAEMEKALSAGPVNRRLFDTYLAAMELLEAAQPGAARAERSVWDQGTSGADLVERVVLDESKPVSLRALAVSLLPDPDKEKIFEALRKCLNSSDMRLQFEAVRALAASSQFRAVSLLKQTAFDAKFPGEVRAEALWALAGQPAEVLRELVPLLQDAEPGVRMEAVRTLRMGIHDSQIATALLKKLDVPGLSDTNAALRRQIAFGLAGADALPDRFREIVPSNPSNDVAWMAALSGEGSADAGRRIFFSQAVGCANCHRVQGRGGQAGPDLSTIGRSSDRARLVQAILKPSQDIAPQFVQYHLAMKDGEEVAGVLLGREADGTMILGLANGQKTIIPGEKIASVRPSAMSLMPEGFEKLMSQQDFRDLLVFLQTLR